MEFTLESLGLTKEELQERVIDRIADRVLHNKTCNEYGDEDTIPSSLKKKLDNKIMERIEEEFRKLADKAFPETAQKYLEGVILQRTNQWGESQGKAVTVTEYIVQLAESYLHEEVDSRGRTAAECRRSHDSFYAKAERLTYMIDQYIGITLRTAIEEALKDGMSVLGKSLIETCKMQLAEASKRLKFDVKTS